MSKRGRTEDPSAIGVLVARINDLEDRLATAERNAERSVPPEGFRWDSDTSQGPALRRVEDDQVYRLT